MKNVRWTVNVEEKQKHNHSTINQLFLLFLCKLGVTYCWKLNLPFLWETVLRILSHYEIFIYIWKIYHRLLVSQSAEKLDQSRKFWRWWRFGDYMQDSLFSVIQNIFQCRLSNKESTSSSVGIQQATELHPSAPSLWLEQ